MAVYNALTGEKPSTAVALAQNTFVDYLLGNNPLSRDVWSKFDAIIPYGAGMPTAADALLWWNDPTKTAVLSATPPTYVVGQGFTGGANKYINTKFNPYTAVKYTQNDASFVHEFYNVRYEAKSYSSGCGTAEHLNTYFVPYAAGELYYAINAVASSHFNAIGVSGGIYTAVRNSATVQTLYRGTQATSNNVNSATISDKEVYNLATNYTTVIEAGDDTIGLAMYGSSLTEDDVILINQAWADLKNKITVYDETGDGGIILQFDDVTRNHGIFLSHIKARFGATKVGFCLNGGHDSYVANKKNWDEKKNLGFDILNHSLNHIDWQAFLASNTPAQFYNSQVAPQQLVLVNDLGVTNKYYKYAQVSGYDEELNAYLISQGYKVTTVFGGTLTDYSDFEYTGGLFVITADLGVCNSSWANIEAILEWAKNNNKIVGFTGHNVTSLNNALSIRLEYVIRMIDYVRTNKMKIYGYDDIV